MSSPFISVILITWNSAAHLPRCIDGLLAQSFRDFQVVLVDNGSSDSAVDDLERRSPALPLQIIRLSENRGFAAANNIGARRALGRWLALLNPDAFPAPDWLEHLVGAALSTPQAFFASRQLQADRSELLDGEGDVFHASGLAWRRNHGLSVYPAGERREVFSACAAAALYPRQEFIEAGGFDEDYFAYHEDVDLGFRLRLRGLRCFYVPTAVVHHLGSASYGRRSDFSIYHGHRNLVWTFVKDMPAPLFWLLLPLHMVMNLSFLIWFSLTGNRRAIWRAKLDAARGFGAALRKRRAVQRTARVSLFAIGRQMNGNLWAPFQAYLQRIRARRP